MKSLRGFSLPTAIFLLVILALLGAFMISLSTTQNAMSVQDVQGSRAYHAARGGMEWALYNLKLPATACPAASTALTIDGFSVAVNCSRASHDEGGTTRAIHVLPFGQFGGGRIPFLGAVGLGFGGFDRFSIRLMIFCTFLFA